MDIKASIVQEDTRVFTPSGGITFSCDAPKAPDGYQERAIWLLESASLTGFPPEGASLYLFTAQRRCDSAHRQLMRVRHAIEARAATEPDHGKWLTSLNQIIGDTEMAMSSLHLAVKMAASLPGFYGVRNAPVPKVISRNQVAIRKLRHAFEHIDERARGRIGKQHDPKALAVFDFSGLLERGEITDGTNTFNIYRPATDILLAVRDYIELVWGKLIVRSPST